MSKPLGFKVWCQVVQDRPFGYVILIETVGDSTRYLGTYAVLFRHKRFSGDDISGMTFNQKYKKKYSKICKNIYGYTKRAYTKCMIVRVDQYDEKYYIGRADCAWMDNFSRPEGRYLSCLRATEELMADYDSIYEPDELTGEFTDKGNQVLTIQIDEE